MATEQQLKGYIYSETKKIVRECGAYLNLEYDLVVQEIIAELVWKKLAMYGEDLEAFEKHAKRTTVMADDVKLLVRGNESLKELVAEKLQEIAKKKPEPKAGAKRKRKEAPVVVEID